MPRTLQEILDHAEDLADQFEADDFGDENKSRDAQSLRELSRAVQERALAEARVAQAVAVARADGCSWAAIGLMLGTSGEAARQRYDRRGDGRTAQPTETAEEKLVDLLDALEASVREAKEARDSSAEAAAMVEFQAAEAALAERLRDLQRDRPTSKPARSTRSVKRGRPAKSSATRSKHRRRAG